MSPNKRDREYERRRWEKWQKKQEERIRRQRRTRQTWAALGALAAVVVAVALVFLLVDNDDPEDVAAPETTSSPSASPTSTAKNPCGPVTVKPPAKPKSWSAVPAADTAQDRTWTVTLGTNCGDIELSLDGRRAPQAVASTLHLVREGFYTGTPCHRLTTEGIHVLQCGDPTGTGTGGPGYSYGPVENAPKDDVYPAGTVAMARQGGNGSSMGSQFFLVYQKSSIPSDAAGGYTVLGKITKGLDIVKKIAAGGTETMSGDGKPRWAVSIESAKTRDA
jgi:peptidyl-prolyl cis-trans isomerase B (cyclophilin B)